jgi:hypothetical protein
MSSFLPAPFTMVVLSLSMLIFSAVPSMFNSAFSSLKPRSSLITVATGQDGEIFQHRFATIAEAWCFHGTHFQGIRGSCSPPRWPTLLRPRLR